MARALMFQGTGSDVGKSVIVAGLCRALSRRGATVMPFKPQNMSNNAAVAGPDAAGLAGEIGRAQFLQALAARVPASVHMNPVLLKPQSEGGSQVIVHGRAIANATARDYQRMRPELLDAVDQSFLHLCQEADYVLVEGAGSPAEINLRPGDIANMGFARHAGVPVVMIGDIDRGGVIASLVGTHAVLETEDREMICGFLINRFRGDISLFCGGLEKIVELTGWPSYGVLPWLNEVALLPAEDSVALSRMSGARQHASVTVAVPVTPRIANFDDLDPLTAEPDVGVVFVRPGESLPGNADLVVLAGSKATIGDLAAIRGNGWDTQILDHVRRGGRVIGLCGGFQMLGRRIADPDGLEGPPGEVEGLGLLDIETVLEGEKIVRKVAAQTIEEGLPLEGYEIHLGRTTGPDCSRPMIRIDGRPDGAVSADGLVSGCYLHGLFQADTFRHILLHRLGRTGSGSSFGSRMEEALESLADALEEHLRFDALMSNAVSVKRRPAKRGNVQRPH
jgi:adenosylcobyric acid synthase